MTLTLTEKLLTKARQILSDPAHWTKGAYARNEKGEAVDPLASDACSFCALGAVDYSRFLLEEEYGSLQTTHAERGANLFLREAARLARPDSHINAITAVNDDPIVTHQDLVKIFDQAILLARTPA